MFTPSPRHLPITIKQTVKHSTRPRPARGSPDKAQVAGQTSASQIALGTFELSTAGYLAELFTEPMGMAAFSMTFQDHSVNSMIFHDIPE